MRRLRAGEVSRTPAVPAVKPPPANPWHRAPAKAELNALLISQVPPHLDMDTLAFALESASLSGARTWQLAESDKGFVVHTIQQKIRSAAAVAARATTDAPAAGLSPREERLAHACNDIVASLRTAAPESSAMHVQLAEYDGERVVRVLGGAPAAGSGAEPVQTPT